jgi:acetyl-CoA synthetase
MAGGVIIWRYGGWDGTIREFTYGDLQEHSNRFANVLRRLGVTKGERVFALAGRIPALYIAALGTLSIPASFVLCSRPSALSPCTNAYAGVTPKFW